jgi:23S rRNA (uracil1939-C5)-methyltransferase
MKIKAEKIVFGGDCIGKIDGKTVFVSGILPGETAEIKILQSKKDYDKAIATKILEPSPFRTEPKCKYFGICGGCNLQMATDEYQITLRKDILTDCFKRNIKDDFEKIPEIEVISANNWEYRNRFQFEKGGLQEKSQNKTVKIDFCPVAVEKVNHLLQNKLIPATKDRLFVFDDKTSLDTETYSVKVLDKNILFDVLKFLF